MKNTKNLYDYQKGQVWWLLNLMFKNYGNRLSMIIQTNTQDVGGGGLKSARTS